MKTFVVTAVCFASWSLSPLGGQPEGADSRHAGQSEHRVIAADEIEWKDGPESLPSGAQFAVLEGDPGKEGYFTIRLKVPDGYRIPPHTHPKIERVTVLSGVFLLGDGRKFNEGAMKKLPAGSFFTMPIGMEHYAAAEGETVVQLNGVGPWGIIYVNLEDDPRRQAAEAKE